MKLEVNGVTFTDPPGALLVAVGWLQQIGATIASIHSNSGGLYFVQAVIFESRSCFEKEEDLEALMRAIVGPVCISLFCADGVLSIDGEKYA